MVFLPGIWSMAFSPAERVLASSSGDALVKLWNLKDFSCVRTLQGHAGPVLRVCFLPLGLQVIADRNDP